LDEAIANGANATFGNAINAVSAGFNALTNAAASRFGPEIAIAMKNSPAFGNLPGSPERSF